MLAVIKPVIKRYKGHCAGRSGGGVTRREAARRASSSSLRCCNARSCASRCASLRASAVFSSANSVAVRRSGRGRVRSGRLVSSRKAKGAPSVLRFPDSTRRGVASVGATRASGAVGCREVATGMTEATAGRLIRRLGRLARGAGAATGAATVGAAEAEASGLRAGVTSAGGSSNTVYSRCRRVSQSEINTNCATGSLTG